MGANAKRGSQTQNEIIASKLELPVKNIKHPYSYVTPRYRGALVYKFTLERGFPVYVTPYNTSLFPRSLSCNSVYRERVERY